MGKIIFSSEYFNVKDTLECGQLFRFERHKGGYLVFTCDKCAYVYNDFDTAVIECADGDEEYFQNSLTTLYLSLFLKTYTVKVFTAIIIAQRTMRRIAPALKNIISAPAPLGKRISPLLKRIFLRFFVK